MARGEERRVRMRDNSHAAGGEVSRKLRETLGAYALRTEMETVSPVQERFQDLTVKIGDGFRLTQRSSSFPLSLHRARN